MSARPKVYLSEEDFELIDRAAFGEGYKSTSAFVANIMRKYIEERTKDRGTPYGKSKWKRKTEEEADSQEEEN